MSTTGGDGLSRNKCIETSAELWHKRIRHAHNAAFEHMKRQRNYGMRVKDNVTKQMCETYVLTRQWKAQSDESMARNSCEITVHKDICGAISFQTYGGKSYLLTMTATPQRYNKVKWLSHLNKAAEHCVKQISWLERNSEHKVKRVHSDIAK